jgi:SAM-dependent methyltransferase
MTAFNQHERSQWAGRATAYQGSFAALCAHPAGALLDAAHVKADNRLLDVGTGTGTVAALACARGAHVVAVDAEPSMLELTRRRIPAAEVHQAALPRLPFTDGSFDAAVANFVINHVGDPAAAIRDLQRIVRPGGRIAVTIWPDPSPPAQQLWATIFDAAGVERPTDLPRLTPDKDFPRTCAGLSSLLTSGGADPRRLRHHRLDPSHRPGGMVERSG